LLLSYSRTREPGFDTIRDNFKYVEIVAAPYLYRGCYVVWGGMAANLETGKTGTAFNLLVGYETRKTLGFAVRINTGQPLEMLGKVAPAPAGGLGFELRGVAAHQAGLGDR
jgi:hypothetical protein